MTRLFLLLLSLGSPLMAAAPSCPLSELPADFAACSQLLHGGGKAADDFKAEVFFALHAILKADAKPEEARRQLAALLEVSAQTLPENISLETLVPFEKQIAEAVYLRQLKMRAAHYNLEAMERSIKFLMAQYGDKKYAKGAEYLKKLEEIKQDYPKLQEWIHAAKLADTERLEALVDFRLQALVTSNPAVNFDAWVALRRYGKNGRANRFNDRPANWQGLTSLNGEGRNYNTQVLRFADLKKPHDAPQVLMSHDKWVGMLSPNISGDKLMLTTNHIKPAQGRQAWDVYEIPSAGGEARNLTRHMPDDTDSYDACYLPDGRILFMNTSGMQGVPCVTGNDFVGNMHIMSQDGSTVRRITADQDNNWSPTMLHDGRVLFLRWEYTESAHYYSRILMHMNPDGSDQKEYYGSNSYWPNSLFDARPIPNKPGQFIAVVSGHHGEKRVGELVKFDVNRGRTGTQGAVQKIPGFGQDVPDITKDELVNGIKTPYFAEPYPIDENFFLAACSLKPKSANMNIVFCDAFDNIIPLTASEYFVYAEPHALRPKVKVPIIPDRYKEGATTSTAYISDVYLGRAMEGVPRGAAKRLRIFTSEYSPRKTGSHYAMGMESNWDLKILYGTVPINDDGSAIFEIPANAPVTLQVLDEEGKAIALMRSWMTAMPGEMLSCIGCHENQNMTPPMKRTQASRQRPAPIEPFQGPVRTMSYSNEIQPLLDKSCISCHSSKSPVSQKLAQQGVKLPDFDDRTMPKGAPAPGSNSYWALHPYVRRNGPEGNYLGLHPTEFGADTSELVQMLKRGHHGVELSKEEWELLYTWIDMNVPYLGHWPGKHNEKMLARRRELNEKYFPCNMDYELMTDARYTPPSELPAAPEPVAKLEYAPLLGADSGVGEKLSLELGKGVRMDLRRIPATTEKPFYMGETEVTLAQYRAFDPEYKNGYYDMHYKDQVRPGYDMDANEQFPVIRVSWEKAQEFCKWMSKKTGKKVSLPSSSQWEIAARGGKMEQDFYFGPVGTDFSPHANLADVTMKELAVEGVDPKPIKNANRFFDFVPRDEVFNDKVLMLAPVGSYQANPYGLYDMIGNVAEWTCTAADDKEGSWASYIVRGGSWRDRPAQARIPLLWHYPAWRPVYNVGFRIVIED